MTDQHTIKLLRVTLDGAYDLARHDMANAKREPGLERSSREIEIRYENLDVYRALSLIHI